MKKIIKLTLILLIGVLVASICSCQAIENFLFGGDPYSFSDVTLTQTGINEFRIEFTANCGKDDVQVYFTEGFRLTEASKPIEVEKSVDGRKAHIAFTSKLNLGEDYYVWLVSGDKEARLSVTAPSLFPSLTVNDDGTAVFNFGYTYGTSWESFCDPTGKAIYKGITPVFDRTAELIRDGIEITEESALIPSDKFDANCYYFAVSTAKDGLVKNISSPVMIYNGMVSQITGISAKITSDCKFELALSIPETAEIADDVEKYLSLVVKTDVADDIKVWSCTYSDGVAKMSVDMTSLYFESVWYDVLIAWRGAIVMDVPKYVGETQVDSVSSVKMNSIVYNIVGWKPEEAPEGSEMMKVYFEEDTTRYSEELFRSYLVSFDADKASLNVTVKLKEAISEPPTLAITGGDKKKLASIEATANEDGSYSYSLPVAEALTEADKWYDLRFFVGTTAYEMLKDSCIAYADFAAKYTVGSRIYEFREYNGFLKLMYTDLA